MELLVKAVAAALSSCVMAMVIKKSNPELSLLLSVLASAAVTMMGAQLLSGVLELVELAQDTAGLSSAVVNPVIKCLGLGVVTRLGADMCRDSGQSACASALELTGSAAALVIALPLFRTLLTMIGAFT